MSAATTTTVPTRPAVGDVYVSTWGYDQTNVDFYQVTDVTRCTLVLRKIQAQTQSEQMWRRLVVPQEGEYIGRPFRRHIVPGMTGAVMVDTIAVARPWDGQPVEATSYA